MSTAENTDSAPPVTAGCSDPRVFRPTDRLAFGLISALKGFALLQLVLLWFLSPDWAAHPWIMALLSLIGAVALADIEGQWLLLPFMRRPPSNTPKSGIKVAVATTFVPGGEPLEMLEESLAAMIAIDYPHDTWVLDEGDNDQVKALCRKLGARHFSRKHSMGPEVSATERSSKFGNCNAFCRAHVFGHYDVLTNIDPDHIAKPNFLSLALAHFEDTRVGYVQLPQAFWNQAASFIARGCAEETYAFHSSVQMASHGLGYPVIMGGHSTHRVAALEQIGGFSQHDAEDLVTTANYQAAGWRGVYVPTIAARGLCPTDWASYLKQQQRWARSLLDAKLRHIPQRIANRSPVARALGLGQGLSFVFKSAILPLLAITASVLVAQGTQLAVFNREHTAWWLCLLVGMALATGFRQRFFLDPAKERGVNWLPSLLRFAKWPHMLVAIFDVVFRGGPRPFVLTVKSAGSQEAPPSPAPHVGMVAAIAACWWIGPAHGAFANWPVLLASATFAIGSLFLVLSRYQKFPDPYDPDLDRT